MSFSVSNSRPTLGTNLVLPGSLLAILAVTGYLVYAPPPLESARPDPAPLSRIGYPAPPSPAKLVGAYSPLWEDPLAEAYAQETGELCASCATSPKKIHEQMFKLFQTSQRATDEEHPVLLNEKLHVMAVLMPGEPHAESSETRRRIRYAVTSGLGVAGYHLAYADRITYIEVPVTPYIAVMDQDAANDQPLRVPLKLYQTSDIQPLESDEREARVRIRRPSRVLVLYVNESVLGSLPLDAISQLLGEMFHVPIAPGDETRRDGADQTETTDENLRNSIRVSILGPTSSDVLLAMAKEVDKFNSSTVDSPRVPATAAGETTDEEAIGGETDDRETADDELNSVRHSHKWPLDKMTVFSYRATVGTESLKERAMAERWLDPKRDESTPNGNAQQNSAQAMESSERRQPRVVRTIGTDKQLIEALFAELRLRNALPDEDHPNRHVVLLAERDSLYGRGLQQLFHHRIDNEFHPEHGVEEPNLHIFTYLRGVDGGAANTKNRSHLDQDSAQSQPFLNLETELPQGSSQYDYIRRVAQQVVQLQQRLWRSQEGEISAIGVMGTDIYDKLLILRALRPRLPTPVYFTTDLDAALGHASEYNWTRNLIIASHFGRELHPVLQREAPVFRDSYQTSCFLTTLLAAGDYRTGKVMIDAVPRSDKDTTINDVDPWQLVSDHEDDVSWRFLSPLVFEISRKGPFQLSSTGGKWQSTEWNSAFRGQISREQPLSALVHAPGEREIQKSYFYLWLVLFIVNLIAVGVAVFVYARRVRVAVVGFVDELRKPLRGSMSGGSVFCWFITLVALLLLVLLLIDYWRENGEPVDLVSGISAWPTILLRFVALVLSFYFLRRTIRGISGRGGICSEVEKSFQFVGPEEATPPGASDRESLAKIVIDPQRWPELMYAVDDEKDAPTNPEQEETAAKKEADAFTAWRTYKRHVSLPFVLFRAVITGLLFSLFACLVMYLAEPRSIPVRGSLVGVIEEISFYLSLVGVVLLAFVVLDLTHSVRHFARYLRKHPEAEVFARPEEGGARDLDAPRELIVNRDKIQLLALNTRTTSSLLWAPSVVLVLLMFAHLTIFDNWNLPWTFILPILLCGSAAIYGNMALRNEVRKVREAILRRIRNEQFEAIREESDALPQYRQVIEEIEAEKRGAFRPLAEDPLIQAVGIQFGGLGGALILEQMFRSIG